MASQQVRILVDDRWTGMHGIGRFAREVLARLPAWHPLGLDGSPTRPLEPLRIRRALSRIEHDVFFSPGFVPPLGSRRPFVFTVHDLIHLDSPDEATAAKRLYYQLIIRRAARRAHRVLTVSEYAAQRIELWAGVPRDRIVIAGNGVSSAFTVEGPAHDGPAYLLYVGNHKPHKNVPGLLHAHARLGTGRPHLLFAGAEQPATLKLAERLGVAARVRFTGPVEDDELAALYRGAIALVMPSFIEGFGLPVIEAMACGTPVICSNTTSLPEIVEDAALMVEPNDTSALTAAMRQLINEPTARETLRRRGLTRAAAFTWDNVARSVKSVLESAGH